MKRRLQWTADALTIVVGLAIVAVLAGRFFDRPEPLTPGQIDGAAVGVDFTAASRTLMMVVQSDCRYCEQSKPFYERLPRSGDLQVIIAAPPGDLGIDSYRELVRPDDIVFVGPGELPVSATPTLLLVNGEGVVESAWIGLLNGQREAEVIEALSG